MIRLANSTNPLDELVVSAADGDAASDEGGEVIAFPVRRFPVAARALAASIAILLGGIAVYLAFQREDPEARQFAVEEPAPDQAPIQDELLDSPIPQYAENPSEGSRLVEPGPDKPQSLAVKPPDVRQPTPGPSDTRAPEASPGVDERALAHQEAPISRPVDPSPSEPPPSEAAPERAPILLASVVAGGPYDYVPRSGFDELARLHGTLRSGDSPIAVHLVSPPQVGLTQSATPTLYWYLSRDVEEPIQVSILNRKNRQTVFETRLAGPHAKGIHGLDLASEADGKLEVGVDYRWFVTVQRDAEDRSRDVVASAGIQRVAGTPDSTLEAGGDGPVALHGHALARNGLWYDAFDFISRRISEGRDDHAARDLREMRAKLLESVELDEAAAFDRTGSSGR